MDTLLGAIGTIIDKLGPLGTALLLVLVVLLVKELGGGTGISRIVQDVRQPPRPPTPGKVLDLEDTIPPRRRSGPIVIEHKTFIDEEDPDVRAVRDHLERLERAMNGAQGLVQQLGAVKQQITDLRELLDNQPTTEAIKKLLSEHQSLFAGDMLDVATDLKAYLRELMFTEGDKRWVRINLVNGKEPKA